MQEAVETIAWARRLKIRHLESLLILKDAGTLTEAAQRMHMTQSAMSHWLVELENLAGTPLAVRGRRLQFTPAGEALHRLAVRVLGEVARAHTELDAIAAGLSARLHIGSIWAGVAHLVPQAMVAFQRSHPSVALQMTEAAFNELLAGLEQRELDLVVGSIDARAFGPHLQHELLFEDDICVVAGPQHPLAGQESYSLAELVHVPWVMPPKGTLMRTQLDAAMLEHQGSWVQPKVETAAITTLQTMLQSSDYIGACSGAMARHLQALGLLRVLPLARPIPFGPVGVVWRRESEHGLVTAFVDALRRTAVVSPP
ncbi:MAG: LysR family transcriptional regulator [Comamonas sp.]